MEIATRDAYGKALVKLGKENDKVVVLDSDLAKATKTIDFAKEFPNRFFDMGIAEANMIGVAAGFATCGKIPFASTFAVFATGRVYDQIRVSVCYPKNNVKIGATHAGITVGEDGASHQALEDISLMRSLPNMTVIVPCDGIETEKAVFAAAAMKGPVYLRMGRSKIPVVMDENYKFEIGKGVIIQEGADISIIACGLMVYEALEASKALKNEGINCRVVNMPTIKPIDQALVIDCASRTGAVVTCEEHSIYGGLGSAVSEILGENFPVPMKRIGVKDKFGESGDPKELLKKYGLDSASIIGAVKEVLKRKK